LPANGRGLGCEDEVELRYPNAGLCSIWPHRAQAEQTVLTADPTLAIPKVKFDAKGDLKITASSTSSQSDLSN
jgi:hypothetical protein